MSTTIERRPLLTGLAASALCLAAGSAASPQARAQSGRTIIVGSVNTHRPPYEVYSQPEEFGRGIYPDIMLEIGRRTGTVIRYRRQPQKRHLAAMRSGQTGLEVGISPAWRQSPEDVAISLYSALLHRVEDVVVFRKGEGFPVAGPADLKGRRVVATHGYWYEGSDSFTRIDVYSEADVLRSLARPGGNADCALIDRWVALYYIRQENLPLEVGPLYYGGDGFIRLHKSLADWLPELNAAIAAMRRDGSLDKIIESYTGAATPS